ncbi:LEUCINE-RICH REPEAT PROTEIN KINASE FAMILY PROTEIN [Salix koriyanagi]|uniref:LEUCINE-RICH REPEAT PROTEIN KINASE FAMILY PROTEIN n=1 Tax=Salix koriyanagi TaxID=2511006 RepID=A0A9Q0U2N7_9ROSI|nr:LEUCINE-RICH REPEAT PROTEIN KINASE FAMILY PROTEIN [Salix koriyanagi]
MLRVLLSTSHFLLCFFITAASSTAPASDLLAPPDATAVLAFKYKADLNKKLPFSQNTTSHFCQWPGVKCLQQKITRLVIRDLDLGGIFAPITLSSLDQLRVLGLQNNSLTGPIPHDLSKLTNLKSVFLDHNSFTGSFPPSLLFLNRLRTLDLSYNNLSGPIPSALISLDRLYYLRLDRNRFNGSIPPLNQSSLLTLNVSFNNLSGAIPVTPTLLRFDLSSFSSNPSLCGEIIHKECHPAAPFFGPSPAAVTVAPPPAAIISQNQALQGVDMTQSGQKTKHKKNVLIIGFSSGAFVLIGSVICFVIAAKKQKTQKKPKVAIASAGIIGPTAESVAVMQIDQQESELEEKVKRVQGLHVGKSGSLSFCAGEAHLYTLDHLMRASAELLGRGTMGTTYKAVLDNRLIVSVKRLDASKLSDGSKEIFEQHMESVGGLRHPNLVPLRAYFQAREERLLIYDYQPNGSLFSLIHGSKSTRAKPLHWTSCLKIAEDVAQGLSYIHQAWRLVHGNLKSSNVLLGPDFEACVSDYCLAVLANSPVEDEDDPDASAYKAPETRSSGQQATSKADVYAFGVLLLELITGKPPSLLPLLVPQDLVNWVRSTRDRHPDDGAGEDNRLEMLLEVAIACSLPSPEQRPTMWQVLKMLQEIKETVSQEDSELDPQTGMS